MHGRTGALGADAVGISPDSVAAQKTFSDRLKLNFPPVRLDHAGGATASGREIPLRKKSFGIVRSAFLIDAGTDPGGLAQGESENTVPKALAALRAG